MDFFSQLRGLTGNAYKMTGKALDIASDNIFKTTVTENLTYSSVVAIIAYDVNKMVGALPADKRLKYIVYGDARVSFHLSPLPGHFLTFVSPPHSSSHSSTVDLRTCPRRSCASVAWSSTSKVPLIASTSL